MRPALANSRRPMPCASATSEHIQQDRRRAFRMTTTESHPPARVAYHRAVTTILPVPSTAATCTTCETAPTTWATGDHHQPVRLPEAAGFFRRRGSSQELRDSLCDGRLGSSRVARCRSCSPWPLSIRIPGISRSGFPSGCSRTHGSGQAVGVVVSRESRLVRTGTGRVSIEVASS